MPKKSIKDLGHLWRYTLFKDWIEIDVTDNKWQPTLKTVKTVFCKVQQYKDGRKYVRYNGDSWIFD